MTGATDLTAVKAIAARQRITDEDVAHLRRVVFGDGVAQAHELAALFELNGACPEFTTAWRDFFVEGVVDFLVHKRPPEGYIVDEDARVVIDLIGADGRVKTATELEALIKALEAARAAPETLNDFALLQVKLTVLNQSPPLRLDPPKIELIRRVLYAGGGESGIAVSRREAEVLFDINDRVAGSGDNDAWCDLFAKAVGNHIMAAAGRAVPSRQEALRREQWLAAPSAGVGGFLARMFKSKPTESAESWARRNAETEESIRKSEVVTLGEATWLKDRINRDGALTRAETRLLHFIKDVSPDIAPALSELIAKARAA